MPCPVAATARLGVRSSQLRTKTEVGADGKKEQWPEGGTAPAQRAVALSVLNLTRPVRSAARRNEQRPRLVRGRCATDRLRCPAAPGPLVSRPVRARC